MLSRQIAEYAEAAEEAWGEVSFGEEGLREVLY
jgi:hypothetical protein